MTAPNPYTDGLRGDFDPESTGFEPAALRPSFERPEPMGRREAMAWTLAAIGAIEVFVMGVAWLVIGGGS